MKIVVVGSGRDLAVKKIVELVSKNSQSKCDDCSYTFNKDYENQCPLCGCDVK